MVVLDSVRRVLVLRRGALGDTICFLPVIAAVRASAPRAEITFAGVEELGELFAARDVVERAISSEALGLWRLASGRHDDCVRGLEAYDWLVGDVGELAPTVLAPRVTAFDVRADLGDPTPAATQLLARAAAVWPIAWPDPPHEPRLPRTTLETDAGLVWIHPGSGGTHKTYAGIAALARRLHKSGLRVVVSFGEADAAQREALEPLLPRDVERVSQVSVAMLASRLERAAAYLGVDSGVTHLAAALGVPVVALFGPTTNPAVWAPAGAHVAVVGFGA